jgi:hypothetical protein
MPNAKRNLPDLGYDRDKVDKTVLALLWLTLDGHSRAWKSHDWGVMDRLHERGYICDPRNKAKSVLLTEEGERRAHELFVRHFGLDAQQKHRP